MGRVRLLTPSPTGAGVLSHQLDQSGKGGSQFSSPLCAYTAHGRCGILNEDGTIDNARSIKRLAQQAASCAKAGNISVYYNQ